MFRALFRRLPLAASLVVLLTISLFSVAPMASAKSLASSPCPRLQNSTDKSGHCYVVFDVVPISGTGKTYIGASTDMQIFTPTVAPGDVESIAQMVIFGCLSSCSKSEPFDIEVGWIVDPNVQWMYPDGSLHQDSYTHLFVFVRNSQKAAPDDACLVHYTGSNWTCGWNSNYPNGSPDYPGEVLSIANPTNANGITNSAFVIVYSNGSWWIQYNGNWIGNVDGSWFNHNFNSIGEAQWSGEVAGFSNPPATQMGSGSCGTVTNTNTTFSAHMYQMKLAGLGFTTDATDTTLLKSKTTQTIKKYYNGYAYYTSDGGSILTYGGPAGCP